MDRNTDRIVAQVAGQPVMESEIDEALVEMGQHARNYDNPRGRAALLDQIIAQKLFLLDAQRNLLEREPVFKERMKKVRDELLTQFAMEKAVEKVRVSDEEIKAYFDSHPDQFQSGPVYDASHILVKTEEEARSISEEIASGSLTFENAAKKYSSCPSASSGGALGRFTTGQMVPEFESACVSMTPGALSDPVQTQFGWHLIRLNGKEEGGPVGFNDVREEIRGALLAQKQQEAYRSRVNQLKILYPVDKF